MYIPYWEMAMQPQVKGITDKMLDRANIRVIFKTQTTILTILGTLKINVMYADIKNILLS